MTPLLSGSMGRATRFAIGLLLYAVALPVYAATITVTNTNDSGAGSLRQALTSANDGDTITFAVTGTITLTSGGLVIDKSVTISGPGADRLAIDGNQAQFRCVFGVFPGKTVTISGLTVTNGDFGICNGEASLTVSNCVVSGNASGGLGNSDSNYGGAVSLTIANSIISDNSGPGVVNEAHHGPANSDPRQHAARHSAPKRTEGSGSSLTIVDSTVSGSSGVGVYNTSYGSATTTILNSTLTGNYAGGGISTSGFEGFTQVTVSNSTISGNSVDGGGGGIASDYSGVSIVNSTISGNSAVSGGGIGGSNSGITVVNSTITGNSAEVGGGISVANGSLHVANSTLSGNSAVSGGGIYNDQFQYFSSAVEISNAILNAGALGENIFNNGGTVTSDGYNLSSDDGGGYLTGPGDQINTDPLLGPLQDNGGPTLTHMPLPGSPAIDAGDPNFTPPPFYDQRGPCFVRVFHGRIDVGSFEWQPPSSRPCPTPRPPPNPPPRP
jgi:hypothetical protein